MSETVILIVDDLMFLPKLQNSLQASGYQTLTATTETDLSLALFSAPVLAVVDLFSQTYNWERLVRFIKGPGKKAAHVPVLGFGPHVDLALRGRALSAGCNAVVGRSAIVSQLPTLVEKHKWQPDRSRCGDDPPALLLEGIRLFNRGQYFEGHEAIEMAWVAEKGPIRLMYQGVLQIGVACHHIKRKNWRGAVKLLERGIPKTARFAPDCMGINITKLLSDANAIHQELRRLGPEWQGKFNPRLFPIIEYNNENTE